MLLFEFFPAALALVSLIVGVALFARNRRMKNNPDEEETPRTPSQPAVSPEDAAAHARNASRRPSMRA